MSIATSGWSLCASRRPRRVIRVRVNRNYPVRFELEVHVACNLFWSDWYKWKQHDQIYGKPDIEWNNDYHVLCYLWPPRWNLLPLINELSRISSEFLTWMSPKYEEMEFALWSREGLVDDANFTYGRDSFLNLSRCASCPRRGSTSSRRWSQNFH